ncbi:hypothetical protein MTO96_022268 [Rhipicephalus appendiculatus]
MGHEARHSHPTVGAAGGKQGRLLAPPPNRSAPRWMLRRVGRDGQPTVCTGRCLIPSERPPPPRRRSRVWDNALIRARKLDAQEETASQVGHRAALAEIDAGTLLQAPVASPQDLSFKAAMRAHWLGKKEESARSGRASSRLPAIVRPRPKQVLPFCLSGDPAKRVPVHRRRRGASRSAQGEMARRRRKRRPVTLSSPSHGGGRSSSKRFRSSHAT